MDNSTLLILKNEVEQTLGRKVTSYRDCINLCEEIFSKTDATINANTLRRFFGLVKSDYPPSKSTLNILSRYCGFNAVEDISAIRGAVNNSENKFQKESVVYFLAGLFKEIKIKETEDETFLSIVKQIIIFLDRNKGLIEKFQRLIAKTENGQKFYFEKLVNIDQLDAYYGDGLRYYANEKKSTEAQVYVHALLVFRNWLTMENTKLKRHYQSLTAQRLQPSVSYTVYARYFAASLYHAHAFNLPATEILKEVQTFHANISITKNNLEQAFSFELIFSESLLLTGHYEEAFYYTEQALNNYEEKSEYSGVSQLQMLYLTEAIVFYRLGKLKKAKERFRQIDLMKFNILSRKYNTILYFFLMQELKRKDARHEKQLKVLIAETGFVRLLTAL